jgi:DNA-binding response OmpR family regulator
MKVLLVDDDQDQLSLRSMVLKRSGFECFEASSAASALEIAVEQAPICAVVDLRLPTESAGLELIRKLKDFDPQLWIVVLTGANPGRFKKLPEAALVSGILTKPVRAAELVASLRAVPLI